MEVCDVCGTTKRLRRYPEGIVCGPCEVNVEAIKYSYRELVHRANVAFLFAYTDTLPDGRRVARFHMEKYSGEESQDVSQEEPEAVHQNGGSAPSEERG